MKYCLDCQVKFEKEDVKRIDYGVELHEYVDACPNCNSEKLINISESLIPDSDSPKDNVNPAHYDGDYCMQVIEHITKDLKGDEGYLTGVILKYLWRWKRKNGLEDLKKIRWYLDRLITNLEESE